MKPLLLVSTALFVLLLSLTACGEAAPPSAEQAAYSSPSPPPPSPTQTFTPTPTATLTPSPTRTPTPAYTRTSTPTRIPATLQISPLDGMTVRYIYPGSFQMGGDVDQAMTECRIWFEPFSHSACDINWFLDEAPIHTVTLDAFWMDTTEVTNAMYARCVAAGACSAPIERDFLSTPSHYGELAYADYPVTDVVWSQAVTYCAWVGGTLPTEAQWEYAARGRQAGLLYPWGNTFDGTLANICDVSCGGNRYFDDGYADTAPVGSYPANGLGLFDMAGNVEEWTLDWYGRYTRGAATNPTGPVNGQTRVIRGGGCYTSGDATRVAHRNWNYPDIPFEDIGFRCVRAP